MSLSGAQDGGEHDGSDLIRMGGPLTMEAVLRQLHQNFMEGRCYTWIGPMLLCVNPYENPSTVMSNTLKTLTDRVLEELQGSRRTRTLVFRGCSGSGKSFTVDRLIIKMFSSSAKSEWLQDLRKFWQVSSVVLKALATAGTPSNKDSSRMGRGIDFYFSGMQIMRIKVNCYFLDQSRLVCPNPSEQSYHIFYQILAGLSPEERSRFHFPHTSTRSLNYLSQACDPPDSPQLLQSHFEAWKSSLAQLGIPLSDVLKVLVATLLLGNILFYESKNQELSCQGVEELKDVAYLLGVQAGALQRGLTVRTHVSKHGTTYSTCSAAAGNSARDALAKALYVRTMVAIIRRVNTLLKGGPVHSASPTKPHGGQQPLSPSFSPTKSEPTQAENMVSLLDFFGFENSSSNSLEQLSINWTAERLQYTYSQMMFGDTLRACQVEEIDPLFHCAVHDCSPCIELIGNNYGGLIKELNTETIAPRVSSGDIRVRMKDKFSSFHCFAPPVGSASTFAIKHFHGEVVYETYNILNANADTVADDIVATFTNKECKFGFVCHLFAAEASRELHPDGNARGHMCKITPSLFQHHSQTERHPTSFMQDFQTHIEDALNALRKSKPRYIMCLKSNSTQTPGRFDREVVSQQIKDLTIFETVDLMQGGYFHYMSYKDFVKRYQSIAPDALERLRSRPYEMTEDLLAMFARMLIAEGEEISEEMWAIGKNKVFIMEELHQLLERLRKKVRTRAIILIQSVVRGFLVRKQWPQYKYSLQQQMQSHQMSHSHGSRHHSVPDSQRNGTETSYSSRNYTIVGNYKVAFPQWRIMRCPFPDSGPAVLRAGDEVFVLGRSQKRGFLVVEYGGRQMHLPHYTTELRLAPPPPHQLAPPPHQLTQPPHRQLTSHPVSSPLLSPNQMHPSYSEL